MARRRSTRVESVRLATPPAGASAYGGGSGRGRAPPRHSASRRTVIRDIGSALGQRPTGSAGGDGVPGDVAGAGSGRAAQGMFPPGLAMDHALCINIACRSMLLSSPLAAIGHQNAVPRIVALAAAVPLLAFLAAGNLAIVVIAPVVKPAGGGAPPAAVGRTGSAAPKASREGKKKRGPLPVVQRPPRGSQLRRSVLYLRAGR